MRRLLPWLCAAALAFGYRSLLGDSLALAGEQGVERAVFGERQEIAFLVVLASGWLAWRRWPRLAAQGGPARGWAAGVAALGIACFAWASYTASELLRVASLLPLLAAFALAARGAPALRGLALPLGVLLLALPLPPRLFQSLVWPLQLAAARAGSELLDLAGVHHTRSGVLIARGDVHFLVAEPCSGLQGLATLTLLAVIVRELLGTARRRSWLVVALAPALAFGLNALRVAWIACLDQAQGEAASHTSQGMAVLVAGAVALYAAGLAVCGAAPAEPPRPGPLAAPGAGVPWRTAAAAAALLAGLSLLPRADAPRRAQPPLSSIPLASPAGWRSAEIEVDRQFLGTLSIGSILSRRYSRPAESVELRVGADAGLPSRSPFSPKTLLPGRGFRVEERERRFAARLRRRVDVAVVRDASEQRLVYHWRFGDRGFPVDLLGDLVGLDASPFAAAQARGFAQLSTPIAADAPDARKRATRTLERFLLAFASGLAALDGG